MMQPQLPDDPLQDAYLALASLDHRMKELRILMDAMSTHMIGYPALFAIGQAEQWKEEMFRLIKKAEDLQKEETIEHTYHF